MRYVKQFFTKKHLLFIGLFTFIGLLALQIPVAQIGGSQAQFTAYDAFAPIAGSFIGSIAGVIAVFLMQLFNFLVHGAHIEDAGTIVRFLPMLFAVLYFAKKGKFNIVVPVVAIIGFMAHPIGREVWYFSLLWTIPMISYFLRDRFILARALGATFTAHAVGGVIWIWVFALPAPVWIALIPIVIVERLLFALGITASFVFLNNLLCLMEKKHFLRLGFNIDQKYLIHHLRHRT